MFRTTPLSIIRSFSLCTQQWYMSYRFADSCSIQSSAPEDGRNYRPKHVQLIEIANKITIVASSPLFILLHLRTVGTFNAQGKL